MSLPGQSITHTCAVEQASYEVRDGKAAWGGRLLRDWVPDIVAAIVREFDPVLIVLFGSVAEGTDGPDSDLDLLVVLEDAPLDRRRDLMFELRRATRRFRVPRDILVTSKDDFSQRASQAGTTEHEPAQNGVVVHERRPAA